MDLPNELQVQATEVAALIRMDARLRDQGIYPSGVLMQIPPGMDPDDQPHVQLYGLPVVWSKHPGTRLIIDVR